jgi:hypothetical protein
VRRQGTDGVVVPVVPEPSLHEVRVLHELVQWEQGDACDAKGHEVVEYS